jgi:hypothetical protein
MACYARLHPDVPVVPATMKTFVRIASGVEGMNDFSEKEEPAGNRNMASARNVGRSVTMARMTHANVGWRCWRTSCQTVSRWIFKVLLS